MASSVDEEEVCTCRVENIEVPRIYGIDSCIRQPGWRGRGRGGKNIRGRCREHDIAHRVTNNVLLRLKTVTGGRGGEGGGTNDILKPAVPFFLRSLFHLPSLPPLLPSSPPRPCPPISLFSSILLHDRLLPPFHFYRGREGGRNVFF